MTLEVSDNVKDIPELSEEEKELWKHLDTKNKLNCITLDITWKVGNTQIPTNIRIDKNLLNYEQIPEPLKTNGQDPYFHFARCIWGNLQWPSPNEIKSNMIKDIKKNFNNELIDVYILKAGHIHISDTVIITDTNNKTIVWIKFLRKEITEKEWRSHQESRAGKESVIMPVT